MTTLNELKFPFIQRDFKQKNLSIYMRGSLKFNNFLPSDITTFTVVYNLHKSKNEQSKLDNYHNYIQSNGLSDNSPHHMSKQWWKPIIILQCYWSALRLEYQSYHFTRLNAGDNTGNNKSAPLLWIELWQLSQQSLHSTHNYNYNNEICCARGIISKI